MRDTRVTPARTRRAQRSAAIATALAAVAASFAWPAAALAEPDPGPQSGWQASETFTTSHLNPRDVAVSPGNDHLFVNYEDGDVVNVIDVATKAGVDRAVDGWGEPILTVPAPDGYRVLAAGTNDVYSLTPGTWAIASEAGPGVDAMTYSQHTGTVFSVDGGLQLSERNPLTGALERWAGLSNFSMAIAAHPSLPIVYTANMIEESVTAIALDDVEWGDICGCENASTMLDLPGSSPADIAISPDGSALYVLDDAGALFSIDTATFTLTDSQSLDGMFPSASLSVNPVTGEIVAADLLGDVFIIDPASLDVTDTVALSAGLWDTAISPDGTRIYVTNTWDSVISVLEHVAPAPDPATNVRATPGARQAAVLWGASATGSPTYTVTAAGSDQALCVTTATFCIITGLPVGPVQFVVTATTDTGSTPSQPSQAVTITAPAAPASVPIPTGGATIAFAGSQPASALFGQKVDVVATGFAPASFVDVSLHSSPVLLGSGQVGADGTATFQVTIPASGIEPGAHHLVASGFTAQGAPAAAVRQITLAAAPAPKPTPPAPDGGGSNRAADGNRLASTGSDADRGQPLWAAAILLTVGAAAVTAARLRRRA